MKNFQENLAPIHIDPFQTNTSLVAQNVTPVKIDANCNSTTKEVTGQPLLVSITEVWRTSSTFAFGN